MSRYRTTCSCCGHTVTKEDRALPENDDSEGNLCGSCYGQQSLDAWFEMQETFDLVTNAIKNPISALRWRYTPPYLKWHHCTNLMAKGILNYKIG